MAEPSSSKPGRLAPNASATSAQAHALAKLLANPDKPVHIPEGPREKMLRAPREMMKNVQGSSAGAGSGEFHVYKESRRREYERLKLLDESEQKQQAELESLDRAIQFAEQQEQKASKNRAKRARRNANKGGSKGKGGAANGEDDATPIELVKKVGGAAIKFRVPGEASDDEDEDDQQAAKKARREVAVVEVPQEELQAAAYEPGIVIRDDEEL